MAIELPGWLETVAELVGGEFPDADEDALRRLAEAYQQAAEGLSDVTIDADRGADEALSALEGEIADKFGEMWKGIAHGDEAALVKLQKSCEALGQACDETALDVEYTKLTVILSLVALVVQLAVMAGLAFFTAGASTAAGAAATAATRSVVMRALQTLLTRITTRAGLQALGKHLAVNLAIEMGTSLSIDVGTQAYQMSTGERKDFDGGKFGQAAVQGAVGGVVGGAFEAGGEAAAKRMFGGTMGRSAGEAAGEAAAEVTGNAASAASAAGRIAGQGLAEGASGAGEGAVGGAIDEAQSAASGQGFDWGNVGKQAAGGAIAGGVMGGVTGGAGELGALRNTGDINTDLSGAGSVADQASSAAGTPPAGSAASTPDTGSLASSSDSGGSGLGGTNTDVPASSASQGVAPPAPPAVGESSTGGGAPSAAGGSHVGGQQQGTSQSAQPGAAPSGGVAGPPAAGGAGPATGAAGGAAAAASGTGMRGATGGAVGTPSAGPTPSSAGPGYGSPSGGTTASTPSAPAAPSAPGSGSTPGGASASGSAPSAPSAPGTPSTPGAPTTPGNPSSSGVPSNPGASSTPGTSTPATPTPGTPTPGTSTPGSPSTSGAPTSPAPGSFAPGTSAAPGTGSGTPGTAQGTGPNRQPTRESPPHSGNAPESSGGHADAPAQASSQATPTPGSTAPTPAPASRPSTSDSSVTPDSSTSAGPPPHAPTPGRQPADTGRGLTYDPATSLRREGDIFGRPADQAELAGAGSREITASAVPGSSFHGHGTLDATAEHTQRLADQGRQALPRVGDGHGGLRITPQDDGTYRVADAHGSFTVDVRADQLPDDAAARSTLDHDNGRHVIELSDRLAPRHVDRAVAHELGEIVEDRNRHFADDTDADADAGVLRPGDIPADAKLTPHDAGRVQELRVLGEHLDRLPPVGERTPDQQRQYDEIHREGLALVDHLGLRGDTPGFERRRDLALDRLTPEGQDHVRSLLDDTGRAVDALPAHDRALLDSVQPPDGQADDPGAAGLSDAHHLALDGEARVALDALRSGWPELDRVLTDNPVAHASLLSHPESVKMLDAALRDVQYRVSEAGIADAVRRGEITPEVQVKVDSIVNDLRAEDPNQVLDKPEHLAISREIAAGTTRDGYRQSGFDLSRRENPAYQQECVDRLRAEAPLAQEKLNRVVSDIASDNGGEPSWRPQVKDRDRALDKVREYVDTVPDGDASMLVDVVGAKIRFGSVDELYRALEELSNDPRLDIVRIKDRVAEATKSGNRSILMNVRLAEGQVAELKFGLKSFETPAAAEHPLYEVRRDMDSIALAEHRPQTPIEALIKAATEAHARRDYGGAWNREMAGSRLHEVLTGHPEIASIAQRLVVDSVVHPTNVAKSLADPTTRDATIGTIGELADGRALDGRALDEYRAARPGEGPLFEPVDPTINTDQDGRDRKAQAVKEAKQADSARDVGSTPSEAEFPQLNDYARRLREDVHPAVEAEVRRLVEQVGGGSDVSVRTKSAEGILDKVERMTTGSPSRPPRPDYRAGDVIDAVGARITTTDMHELGQILAAAKSRFGVGDDGRILEIENMYASPKKNNPAYRVIPLVVRTDVDGLPYTFELQLTTRRASIAADLEHNTVFKPYVEMSPAETNTIRRMLAEAAALDQEETRWNH